MDLLDNLESKQYNASLLNDNLYLYNIINLIFFIKLFNEFIYICFINLW